MAGAPYPYSHPYSHSSYAHPRHRPHPYPHIHSVSHPSIHLPRAHHTSLSTHTVGEHRLGRCPMPTLRELLSKYTRQVIRGVKDDSFRLIKDHYWAPEQVGSIMTVDDMKCPSGRATVASVALRAAKLELKSGREAPLSQAGFDPPAPPTSPLRAGSHTHYDHTTVDPVHTDDPVDSPTDVFSASDSSRRYTSSERSTTVTPSMSPCLGTSSDDSHLCGPYDMEQGFSTHNATFVRTESRNSSSSASLPFRTTSTTDHRIRKSSIILPTSMAPLSRTTSNDDPSLQRRASRAELAKVKDNEAARAKEAKLERELARAEEKRARESRKQQREDEKYARELQAKENRLAAKAAQRASSSTKIISKVGPPPSPRTEYTLPPSTVYVPVPTAILDVVPLPYLTFFVNRIPIKVLIDSGAMLNLIHPHVRDRLGLTMRRAPGQLAGVTGSGQCEGICEGAYGKGVELASRDPDRYMSATGASAVPSSSSSSSSDWLVTRAKFIVGPAGGSADAILGMPWIVQARVEISYHPGTGVWVSFDAEPPFSSTLPLSSPSSSTPSLTTPPPSSSLVKRLSLLAASESDLGRGYTWPSNYSSLTTTSTSTSTSGSTTSLSSKQPLTASFVSSLSNYSTKRFVFPPPRPRLQRSSSSFSSSDSMLSSTTTNFHTPRLKTLEKRFGLFSLGATTFAPQSRSSASSSSSAIMRARSFSFSSRPS